MNLRTCIRYLSLILPFFLFPYFVCLSHSATFTLQWDPNAELDLAGYRLYYGTASRDYSEMIDLQLEDLTDPDNPQHSVSGLHDGVTYYFAVTAYDTVGNESGFSDEVSGVFVTRLVIDVKVKKFKLASATELEVQEMIGSYMGIQ